VSYLEHLEREIKNWESQSLHRQLRFEPELLDFSSNDYLCLNSDGSHWKLLQELLKEKPGTNVTVGSTGSRLIRGHWPSFDEAENAFNAWAETPSSLLFQSGYSANVGTLSALTGPGDIAFCDRLCHASLLDGVRLSGAQKQYFQHNDLNHLESLLKKKIPRKRRWILCESVFSMDGDIPDLAGLLDLCRKYDATLFLDEAHALGYYGSPGNPGAGLLASLKKELAGRDPYSHVILSAPLGKAPGIMGAFVAGHPLLRQFLVNRARSFVFSTAQPPVLAALITRILENFRSHVYDHRIAALRENVDYFKNLLKENRIQVSSRSAIIPVVLGEADVCLKTSRRLKEIGMDVRAIRPPTVAPGSSRLRIAIHSCHTRDQLGRLLDVILEMIQDLNLEL
tara:strand:+ start:3769 stop:4956 length:1188 start_codon:yes stop_codon:yes gene_type:complete